MQLFAAAFTPSQIGTTPGPSRTCHSACALGLTTVEWPLKDMTEAAVASIINVIEGRSPMTDVHPSASIDDDTPDGTPIATIPTRPVWRSSVARHD